MRFADPAWQLLHPARPTGTGVLLLAGSSGRVDRSRAELLRSRGAVVLAIRWFGGPRQQPGPYDVPVELFTGALDVLEPLVDRLAVVGTSFGGEAALVTAALDPRVRAVVGFAASSVVWPGWDGERWTSHWTWRGRALPHLSFDPAWRSEEDPPRFLPLYRRAFAGHEQGPATIRVEDVDGDVLLVVGGDDQVWPTAAFAESIRVRRAASGLATEVVSDDRAGHRAVLPGEDAPAPGIRMARGGTPEADAALGARAWPSIVRVLGLRADGA